MLRGAGKDETFLEVTNTYMRGKTVVYVTPSDSGHWWSGPNTVDITSDLPKPTKEIPVTSTRNYKVGDWIFVRTDATDEFIADHNMTGKWTSNIRGSTYLRKITAITNNTIHIDIPTHYYMLRRDNARFHLNQSLSFSLSESTSL